MCTNTTVNVKRTEQEEEEEIYLPRTITV